MISILIDDISFVVQNAAERSGQIQLIDEADIKAIQEAAQGDIKVRVGTLPAWLRTIKLHGLRSNQLTLSKRIIECEIDY